MAFFPLSKMSRVLIGSTAWVKKSLFGMRISSILHEKFSSKTCRIAAKKEEMYICMLYNFVL